MKALPPLRKLPEPLLRLGTQLLVVLPNNLDQEDVQWLERWTSLRLSSDPELTGLVLDCSALRCTDLHDLRQLAAWLGRLHEQGSRICITGINPGLEQLLASASLELSCDQVAADLNTLLARA